MALRKHLPTYLEQGSPNIGVKFVTEIIAHAEVLRFISS